MLMESNFHTRYQNKLDEFSKRISKSKSESEKNDLENQLTEYILSALPYLEEFENDNRTVEIHPVFGNVVEKGVQKKDLYHKYLREVEQIDVKDGENICCKPKKNAVCKVCKSSNTCIDYQESNIVCKDCASTEFFQCEELSYKEEQETSEKIMSYSYKRDNHFNEWILQMQAQEQTNIPDEVIEQLRIEFKKQKIKDVKEITPAKVRQLLKKTKLNKYYEHIPYITNILNGFNPPKLSPELEDKLRRMFKDIQEPFNKHCPENRKNFLSYSYVLYKFCELLEEDEFLPFFPLLKAKEKLHQQDVIWKNICKELQWQFIPTV